MTETPPQSRVPSADRAAGLPQAKKALYEQWLRGRIVPQGGGKVVTSRPKGAPLRLTANQQRIWTWQTTNPTASTLNLHFLLHVDGPLDVAALRLALDVLHRRHEALRTSFPPGPDGPVPSVRPDWLGGLVVEDVGRYPEPERLSEAVARARAEGVRPFDLAAGETSRSVLYRLSEHTHVLLLAIHHIVFDQWSMGVVLKELASHYESAVAGAPPLLAPLPVQYGDFAHWEHDWLQGQSLAGHKQYWAEQVASPPPALRLPGYRASAGPVVNACMAVELEQDLSERLMEQARKLNVSPHAVLLTILVLTLRSLTGLDDFCIATPAANRNYSNVQELIGFFSNNLPLRLRLGLTSNFSEALALVRRASSEALAYQELPISVISELRSPDQRQAGLYQLAFSYQNAPIPDVRLGTSRVEPLVLDYGGTTIDLVLYLIEAAALTNRTGRLAGMIHYNANNYSGSVVQGFWAAFVEGAREVLGSKA
jgi:hypothetical protein